MYVSSSVYSFHVDFSSTEYSILSSLSSSTFPFITLTLGIFVCFLLWIFVTCTTLINCLPSESVNSNVYSPFSVTVIVVDDSEMIRNIISIPIYFI